MRKSTSKCDVEISITMDGMETVEPVPECLQEVFLSHSSEQCTIPENHVVLPRRYAQWVSNCTDAEKEDIGRETADDKLIDRERDLGTALNWVKQEIKIMKEQDKILMKQFVTLRSKILQLRCLYDFNSSNSDLSMDGSTLSLDDTLDSPCSSPDGYIPSPLHNPEECGKMSCSDTSGYLTTSDMDLSEFRTRTSSLLIPNEHLCHVPVTRIKWKSNEYL